MTVAVVGVDGVGVKVDYVTICIVEMADGEGDDYGVGWDDGADGVYYGGVL